MFTIVISTVSDGEAAAVFIGPAIPSSTTRLNVRVSGVLLVSVGAVNVGELAVSSDRVTPVPPVCVHL